MTAGAGPSSPVDRAAEGVRQALEGGYDRGILERAPGVLARRKYLLLPALLPRSSCEILRDYFWGRREAGQLTRDGEPTPGRLFAYNDPVAQGIHRLLTRTVERATGVSPLRPTYSFWSDWDSPGGELPQHRDRPQCEWSLNALIHQAPEGREFSWPLCMEDLGKGGFVDIEYHTGDAVLYRGCELTHYREGPCPGDHQSMALLFHWVGPDFVGSLD